MKQLHVIVRPVGPDDRLAWLTLWSHYCAFYGVSVPTAATHTTWERLVAADHAVRGLVAAEAATGAVVGFANYVLHPFTWGVQLACYLEDLFVAAEMRGAGAGRALIDGLIDTGKRQGWSRVYWMTQESNRVARRLYDGYAAADDFVRYSVALDDAPAV